jgi:hypothetical protein
MVPGRFHLRIAAGQFRNWFYSLLAMSTVLENREPFRTILGHALVKDEKGNDMHKSAATPSGSTKPPKDGRRCHALAVCRP